MGFAKSEKDKEALKKTLSDMQYNVTQCSATEPPFKNEYWNNHKDGIYIDITTGEALFSSTDKFDSGTGWPSFTKPIKKANVSTHDDHSAGMDRTEVRSHKGDNHLGHLFNDGPGPDHARYCINSASLKFIPVEDLAKSGYSEYLPLFKDYKKSK